MKKIAILTSLLALMACGGGGGGSSASADRSRPRDTTNLIVPESTYNSNHKVTSMVSRLLIARDGSGHSLARSGSTIFAGAEYDEYDLSDVDFNLSDEGFGGIVKFGVDDDKKIINFSMVNDDTELKIVNNKACYTDVRNGEVYLQDNIPHTDVPDRTFVNEDGIYTYKNTSTDEVLDKFIVFNNTLYQLYEGDGFVYNEETGLIEPSSDSPYKIAEDGSVYTIDVFNRTGDEDFTFAGQVTVQGGAKADATLTYNSTAKNMSSKTNPPLRYSDFGYFELNVDGYENETRPVSVIGGYKEKLINHKDLPESEMVFSGRATGSVVALRGDNDAQTIRLNDNNSKLTFNGETKTASLDAKFTNWYDVKYNETYDSSGTATNRSINYSNYADDPETTASPNYFRMLSDTYDDVNGTYLSDTNVDVNDNHIGITTNNVESDLRYYGDNGTPSEMVGLIQSRECAGECGDSDEIRMNLGFGGTLPVTPKRPQE